MKKERGMCKKKRSSKNFGGMGKKISWGGRHPSYATDKYAFTNRPRTGHGFFANANLYLRNVLRFVGKHSILQITPGEESWGLKSRLWGARSNFWFFSAIFSAISFLSATVSFCFVCIRYGYLFKCTTITFLPVDMLKFKDFAATPKRSFRAPLNRFLYHLYNLVCTSPGSSRMVEMVRGFLIKVNRSPIRRKLTDPVLDD